ncbi:hypothetical protein OC948_15200 [Pseudomonas koreensis]|uniref:Uncharacterized protein n=1 Tax=Pseudomonas koreensis TaxID=198620 RepID=A0A9X3BAS6_9PSED|nr:hypothetical protein [Pseudomonas koreensis]MCU7261866.1 hypothetical protein [Pseudomonas koreensis]
MTGRDRVGSPDLTIGFSLAAAADVARRMPGKLSNNGTGKNKGEPWLALFICGPFQGG